MPSNYSSLTVTWYDEDDVGGAYAGSANITSDVKAIPLFTDTGTGEVNQATIEIRALDGRYITSTSPKEVEQFDRIRIQCTDLGGNSYDRFFEIINILPNESKRKGTTLTLECLGIEYHTQHIHFSKPYYFEDSFTVTQSIGDIYNNNRGTEQPKLSNHDVVFTEGNGYGIALPFYNANNWEFGINEDSCYNRWIDLVDGAGAAVSAGGALTFYELSFNTTGVNAMDFKLRKSGDNSTKITLTTALVIGTNHIDVGEQDGIIANPTGTNVLAWGSSDHGSLPVDESKYYSKLLQFIFRPEWTTGKFYEAASIIQVTQSGTPEPKHYKVKAGQGHTSGASTKPETGVDWATVWSQVDMSEEFGDTIQYSPWTDDKATVWSNSGCDPNRTVYTTAGWFDINIVINDNNFFRTWVDARARTDAELNALAVTSGAGYAYDTTRSTFPRGFRILVDADAGAATGDLADFDDMVVEYQPTNSIGGKSWRKLYSFGSDQNEAQVAVLDEGKVYAYTHVGTSWASIESSRYGNDCFHQYTTAPAETDGVDLVYDDAAGQWRTRSEVTDTTERPDIIKSGVTGFSTNQESGIKFIAAASAVSSRTADAHDELDPWNTHTVGFVLRFPYPCCNFNSITEGVGQLYGGGPTGADKVGGRTRENWITATAYKEGDVVYESSLRYICTVDHTSGTFATDLSDKKWNLLVSEEPSTLDIQNMNYTHDGQEGFNGVSSGSEDLGQISAVAFWLRFTLTGEVIGKLDDEHNFRAWFIDTKDNVVYQDFVVNFGNNWEEVILPISGFRNYRGRKPLYGVETVTSTIIPPKDLEVLNIFEWRNIKIFGVQHQQTYDKFGRFNPIGNAVNTTDNTVFWATVGAATRTLELDGFRFIKPLLVTSGNIKDRNLEPDFQQFPNITVYDQLINVAKSHLEIEKFRHKEFNVETSGDEIFDIPFGDSFYLTNTDIISDSDNATTGNIELVNKRGEYSITKPVGGKGGLRRKMVGVKVFA